MRERCQSKVGKNVLGTTGVIVDFSRHNHAETSPKHFERTSGIFEILRRQDPCCGSGAVCLLLSSQYMFLLQRSAVRRETEKIREKKKNTEFIGANSARGGGHGVAREGETLRAADLRAAGLRSQFD